MNKPTKIPLASAASGSSIERAVAAFDLRHFASPPVPAELVAVPARADAVVPVAPAAPVALAAAPAAAPAPVASVPPLAAPERATDIAERPVHAIDRHKLLEAGMVLPEGGTAQLEEFRIVKRQLLLQAEDLRRGSAMADGGGAAQRVMVCSAHPGEGKTFCAVNLALSLAAEKDNEVLLVDLDLARSSVLETLGLPQGPGLMDALADPAIDVRDLVLATDMRGLSVLPGGTPTDSDTEYLASARAVQVLDLLTQGHPRRLVIFDTPPALAASLPAELAKLVGQAVLVVLSDKTSQGAIEDAVSLLAGCANLQLLLNAVQFSPSGRRFGSYYGYRG